MMDPKTYLMSFLPTQKNVGTLFEIFCVEYLRQLHASTIKQVYRNEDIPEDVLKDADWYTRDGGQDLLYQLHDGRYGLIQCKYRSNIYHSLGYKADDLNDFFAQIRIFEKRAHGKNRAPPYIMTTVNAKSRSFFVKQHDDILWICYDDLIRLEVQPVINFLLNEGPVIPTLDVDEDRFQHQSGILEKLVPIHHRDRLKGILKLPCGYGKTNLFLFWLVMFMRAYSHKLMVIVEPKLILIEQTLNRAIPIFTCYQVSVSTWTFSSGKDGSTDVAAFKEWLKYSGHRLILTTYNSLSTVMSLIQPDLIIYDEAHRLNDLNLLNLPCEHLLMTATPTLNLSYLPVYEQLSLSQAIQMKILVDYEIVALGLETDLMDSTINMNRNEAIAELHSELIIQGFKQHLYTKLLVFAKDCEMAAAINTRLTQKGIKSACITGDDDHGVRRQKEAEVLSSPNGVICSVQLYKEGTDRPELDGIFYSSSCTDYVPTIQSMSRCLRRYEHKEIARIVVPVIVGDEDYRDSKMYDSGFNTLLTIIHHISHEDPTFYPKSINSNMRSTKFRNLFVGAYKRKEMEVNAETEIPEWMRQMELKIYRKTGEYFSRLPRNWRTAVLLTILQEMDHHGIVDVSCITQHADTINEWLGGKGETPHCTISRQITDNLVKHEKLLERLKTGRYYFVPRHLNEDVLRRLFGILPIEDLQTFPIQKRPWITRNS